MEDQAMMVVLVEMEDLVEKADSGMMEDLEDPVDLADTGTKEDLARMVGQMGTEVQVEEEVRRRRTNTTINDLLADSGA